MSHKILPKFIIPNHRGQKTNCQICNIKFQLLVKQQHQCKRCFRVVCQDCGPQRRMIYQSDGTCSPHRACLICIKQIDTLQTYYQQHKLCFGQDSEFVDDWINKLNKERRDYQNILNEYSEYMTGITNDNVIRFKRQSGQIFLDLMESYNYSFRNFIKIITGSVNQQIFHSKIVNVMIAVYAKVKSMPYVAQLVYLVIFFLCFSNQAHSYFIITRLIQKVYPQYVRVKRMKKDNLLQSSLKTILQMYKVCLTRVDRNQLQVVAQYLQNRFIIYIVSFSLNVCTVPASLYILDEMLKTGNYLALYKGIAGLMANCREQISQYQTYSDVEVAILRNVTLDKLKALFITFEKTDSKFQISNELFDSVEHRKLHQKYKQIESLYNKSQKTLADKQKHIKDMASELKDKKSEILNLRKKIMSLQAEILHISEHIPQLTNYENMKENYEKVTARNIELEDKCAEIQKKLVHEQKLRFSHQKYSRNWQKMEQSFVRQLADLKTKNQIMQIQLAAKQIDFNTSYIERKLQQKNLQIKILTQELNHTKNDLQYYKLKILEKSFSLKNKDNAQNYYPKIDDNSSESQKFQKHIQNTKQLVQNLQNEKSELQKKVNELQQDNIKCQHKIRDLQQKLQEVSEISKILNQIPNQFSYQDSLEQLERIIQKQTNFMKKKSIEDIKQKFQKCFKQLRFRIIDNRLKEQRIRNSPLLKMLNPINIDRIQTLSQDSTSTLNNLMDDLKISGQEQVIKDQIKNKQCQIM